VGTVPRHRRALGENIRHVREAEGLSHEEIARITRLNAAYLRRVESGRIGVSIDALARIAKALRISVNELTAGI